MTAPAHHYPGRSVHGTEKTRTIEREKYRARALALRGRVRTYRPTVHRCGCCGERGHNARTCPDPRARES